jgi:hypothetical protein
VAIPDPIAAQQVRRPAEDWAAAKQTPAHVLAAARAHAFGHAIGREVTEAEFDQACVEAVSLPIR